MVQVTIIATGFEEAQQQLLQQQAVEEIKVKATVLDVGAVCELKQEAQQAAVQSSARIHPERAEGEKQPISAIFPVIKNRKKCRRVNYWLVMIALMCHHL